LNKKVKKRVIFKKLSRKIKKMAKIQKKNRRLSQGINNILKAAAFLP